MRPSKECCGRGRIWFAAPLGGFCIPTVQPEDVLTGEGHFKPVEELRARVSLVVRLAVLSVHAAAPKQAPPLPLWPARNVESTKSELRTPGSHPSRIRWLLGLPPAASLLPRRRQFRRASPTPRLPGGCSAFSAGL